MLKKSSIGLKLTEERLVNFVKDYQNNYELSFTDLFDKNNKALIALEGVGLFRPSAGLAAASVGSDSIWLLVLRKLVSRRA